MALWARLMPDAVTVPPACMIWPLVLRPANKVPVMASEFVAPEGTTSDVIPPLGALSIVSDASPLPVQGAAASNVMTADALVPFDSVTASPGAGAWSSDQLPVVLQLPPAAV